MSEFRKYALFQLMVAGLAVLAVACLYVWSHNVMASQAGFALLALLGARALLARGKRARPVQDERDKAIHQQAAIASYVALWLCLVAWGVAVPLKFGSLGTVPMVWVSPVVWVAAWLVITVQSITILVLDSRGV